MQPAKGVLLVNLGTPDTLNPKDVKRYLLEFLTDRRVIDLPWLQRQLLVRGVIVPKRYHESADSYSQIWTEEGSPLRTYSQKIVKQLQQDLGDAYIIGLAMRYQNPSIPKILKQFYDLGLEEIIVLPLFPQYASATTGSIHQKVMETIQTWQTIPKLTFISHYHHHPAYIKALCSTIISYDLKKYDHFYFSFHGLPKKHLRKAGNCNHCLQSLNCCRRLTHKNHSCYSAQCYSTARAIAKELNLPTEKYTVTFQSRLGKDPWIQPFTAETILSSPHKEILIMCPAFTIDCLETIHEIGIELKNAFPHNLTLAPCLNDSPQFIQALKEICGFALPKP